MKKLMIVLAFLAIGGTVRAEQNEIPSCNVYSWMTRPMSWKGRGACLMRFRVFQIIDDRSMLLEIFGSSEMGHQSLFYGHLSPKVNAESLVDGQVVTALIKITGTKTYDTPMGITKTVPAIAIKKLTETGY